MLPEFLSSTQHQLYVAIVRLSNGLPRTRLLFPPECQYMSACAFAFSVAGPDTTSVDVPLLPQLHLFCFSSLMFFFASLTGRAVAYGNEVINKRPVRLGRCPWSIRRYVVHSRQPHRMPLRHFWKRRRDGVVPSRTHVFYVLLMGGRTLQRLSASAFRFPPLSAKFIRAI
jgi:hypothetical protein